MAPITATADIDRTPDEVFGYITDPARFAEWQRGVTGGHMAGDSPPTVGAKCLTTPSREGAPRSRPLSAPRAGSPSPGRNGSWPP